MFYIIVKFLKALVAFFIRVIFRLEVRGIENIPKHGGAMIIANHVSFLDNMVLVTVMPRDVGFVMASKVYHHPMLRWLFKRLPMVPIETGKNKSYLEKFNKSCQDKINEGNLVCIYPEGQISNNGHLLEFQITHGTVNSFVTCYQKLLKAFRSKKEDRYLNSSLPVISFKQLLNRLPAF